MKASGHFCACGMALRMAQRPTLDEYDSPSRRVDSLRPIFCTFATVVPPYPMRNATSQYGLQRSQLWSRPVPPVECDTGVDTSNGKGRRALARSLPPDGTKWPAAARYGETPNT